MVISIGGQSERAAARPHWNRTDGTFSYTFLYRFFFLVFLMLNKILNDLGLSKVIQLIDEWREVGHFHWWTERKSSRTAPVEQSRARQKTT